MDPPIRAHKRHRRVLDVGSGRQPTFAPAERVDDTGQTKLDRTIGSATQRQRSRNHYNAVLGTWTRIFSPRSLNSLSVSVSTFHNTIDPTAPGLPQYTFPSMVPAPLDRSNLMKLNANRCWTDL